MSIGLGGRARRADRLGAGHSSQPTTRPGDAATWSATLASSEQRQDGGDRDRRIAGPHDAVPAHTAARRDRRSRSCRCSWPARALAYRPFGSRSSHTASGVSTNTSTNAQPGGLVGARARSRSARYGLITGTSTTSPASAIRAATSPIRRTFSRAVGRREPEVGVEPVAHVVAVEDVGGAAGLEQAVATASASVDLPDPDSPVNHTVAPASPWRSQRRRPIDGGAVPGDVAGRSRRGERDHAGGDRLVGHLVDQHEAAGRPGCGGSRRRRRLGRPQRHEADLVERQRVGRRGAPSRSMSMRWCTSVTIARTERVVCLSAVRPLRGERGACRRSTPASRSPAVRRPAGRWRRR